MRERIAREGGRRLRAISARFYHSSEEGNSADPDRKSGVGDTMATLDKPTGDGLIQALHATKTEQERAPPITVFAIWKDVVPLR